MAIVVVGGSGRGTGKTAVGCALITALPQFRWVAAKVTPHDHGLVDEIDEETDLASEKDSGRYLRAGARRSFLVSAASSRHAEVLLRDVRAAAADCDGLLIESNRVQAELLADLDEPFMTLAAVSGNEDECKESLVEHIARVDAVVVSGGMAAWERSPLFGQRPVFSGVEGSWAEPGLVRYVRMRLLAGRTCSLL